MCDCHSEKEVLFHKQTYAAGGDDCANIIILGILSNPESAIKPFAIH